MIGDPARPWPAPRANAREGAGGDDPADLPLVSVVIPAHDEEAYVRAALVSVLEQRYPRDCLECVVVDNASADATAAVARAFAAACPDLAVTVVAEPVLGVGAAKNRGVGAARGDLLIFLDADSRMAPDLVAAVVAHYRRGSPAGSLHIVADSAHPVERGFFALMALGPILFGLRAQMLYCERALFLSLGGFRPNLHLAEDLEFLQRAREHVRRSGHGDVCYVREGVVATSPRRLRIYPFHLNIAVVFVRWALATAGIGRTRRY